MIFNDFSRVENGFYMCMGFIIDYHYSHCGNVRTKKLRGENLIYLNNINKYIIKKDKI